MGISPHHLLHNIIIPALHIDQELDSKAAQILLLATSAQESHCGEWVVQNGGPALGIYQCEPHTHDLVRNWLKLHEPAMALSIGGCSGFDSERLIYDLRYATQIARALYWSIPHPLPKIARDEMWHYYKQYYNSEAGAATKEEWDRNWETYVKVVL